MHSTRTGATCQYLGVDLSSRYSRRPRPNDVCGLQMLHSGAFEVHFWQWHWDPPHQALDLRPLARELSAATYVLVDGPQALAAIGKRMRESERLCRAAGKTPDKLPEAEQPFATFIHSAVELFRALHDNDYAVSPKDPGPGIYEYYPGAAWQVLASDRLPRKTLRAGREARMHLFKQWGMRFSSNALPTHDENDACLGALLAAAMDGAVPSLRANALGPELTIDRDGNMREGPIIMPLVGPGHGA